MGMGKRNREPFFKVLGALLCGLFIFMSCEQPVGPTTPTTPAAAPTITPNGGTFGGAVSVTIASSGGANIRYTTDGSDPTDTYGAEYQGVPLNINVTTLLKAVAYSSELLPSDASEATFTIPGKVGTPYVTPPAGTYTTAQTVEIKTPTSGATIYYTLDGSAPTSADGIEYTGAITISVTTTIRAIAYKTGETESNVMSSTFTIGLRVATPVFSVAAGTYAASQAVTISTTTVGATIRYTTNGINPTATYGAIYPGGPITVSKTQNLRSIAYQAGKLDSTVATVVYTIALDSNNAGNPASIAFDGTNVYIAYYTGASLNLNFLRSLDNGATWEPPAIIDQVNSVGTYNSMIRRGTSLYISYYDATGADLKVAVSTNGGSTWSVSRVDAVGNVGQYTSICVDAANRIHVAYYDVTNTALKYATSSDGGYSWTASQLDNAADDGKYASITSDAAGNLYVSYYDDTNDDLRYMNYNFGTSTWSAAAAIDNTAGRDVGQYSRIGVDGSGRIFILYHDITAYDLKMAAFNAGWTITTLPVNGDVGSHIALNIDQADHLNVLYYNESEFRLEYVASTNSGTSWSAPVVVEDTGASEAVGQYTALADAVVGPSNTLWAVYFDIINADLKGAMSADDGTTWTIY